MADNRDLANLTGNVAADEVTYSGDTALAQIVRPAYVTGSEGSKTVVDQAIGAGPVNTGTQRTTLASDDPAVTALQTMDDWDESDRCKTNPIAGQAGVAAGAGAVDALTQRIIVASDSPDVTLLGTIDADTGAMVTDLAAIEVLLTGMDADTDAIKTAVETIDNAVSGSGFNVSQIGGVTPTLNTGARDAGTQRVTIATDDALATLTSLVGSSVAHDAADSGNPHKMGGQARTTWPAAVADSDRANLITDKFGRMLVANSPRELRGRQTTTITSSVTETTIVTAGAAGIFRDLYKLVITNISATACYVTIRDATAGSMAETYAVPAGQTAGFVLSSDDAMKQTTAANNWTAECSASVASIIITALYVENKDA